jgi:hypothetical protein
MTMTLIDMRIGMELNERKNPIVNKRKPKKTNLNANTDFDPPYIPQLQKFLQIPIGEKKQKRN